MKPEEIANEILNQIIYLDNKALMAYGSKNFRAIKEHYIGKDYFLGGVQFIVKGLYYKGIVKILLHSSDTYTILFGEIKRFDNVYVDDLIERLDFIEFGLSDKKEYTIDDIMNSLFDDEDE